MKWVVRIVVALLAVSTMALGTCFAGTASYSGDGVGGGIALIAVGVVIFILLIFGRQISRFIRNVGR